MGLVISDASTLIHLSAIDRLDLLREFYSSITVPSTVWKEVVEMGEGRAGMNEVQQAKQDGWLVVRASTNESLFKSLKRDLDTGEAEAIAIAIELSADLILLDELRARQIADGYGLQKIGIVGILIRAKNKGEINLLKPELDRLITENGFWISKKLYDQSLKAVGENEQQ